MSRVKVQEEITVDKCDKCDDYGRVETLNNPDDPKSGSYLPFCTCEYGLYMKTVARHETLQWSRH